VAVSRGNLMVEQIGSAGGREQKISTDKKDRFRPNRATIWGQFHFIRDENSGKG
jgi:hypothetical protein